MGGPIDTTKYCSSISSEAQRLSCQYIAEKCQKDADEAMSRGDDAGELAVKLGRCLASAKVFSPSEGEDNEEKSSDAHDGYSDGDVQFRLRALQGFQYLSFQDMVGDWDNNPESLSYKGTLTGMSFGVDLSPQSRFSGIIDMEFDYVSLDTGEEGAESISAVELGPRVTMRYQVVPDLAAIEFFGGIGLSWLWCDDISLETKESLDSNGNVVESDVTQSLSGTRFFVGAIGSGLSFYGGAINLFAGYKLGEAMEEVESDLSSYDGIINSRPTLRGPFVGLSFDIPKAVMRGEVERRGRELIERSEKIGK